jgi:Zn-dependent peptidase ImmA (M78 family)
MKITLDDLLFTLDIAADVSEAYDLYVHPVTWPRTTDDMKWICSEYLGKKIDVTELEIEAEGRSVEALCVAFADGTFRIGLLSGMEKDEERFVLCKELFHVLLDRIECRNLNLYDHIASFVTVTDSLANKAAAAEELAIIGAMEFLFPFSSREEILKNNTGVIDYAGLAEKYRIPLRFIEGGMEPQNVNLFRDVMPLLARDPTKPKAG